MFPTGSDIKSVLIFNGQADEVGLEILGIVIWQQYGTSRGDFTPRSHLHLETF